MIYIEQNVILQNLSEQDICFDSNLKELIARERNAMDSDLFDQRDSKGQMPYISGQEGLPIDHDHRIYRSTIGKERPKSAARIPSISCAKQ